MGECLLYKLQESSEPITGSGLVAAVKAADVSAKK
jgi:hypothetical protein